jgi:hypothetical protein
VIVDLALDLILQHAASFGQLPDHKEAFFSTGNLAISGEKRNFCPTANLCFGMFTCGAGGFPQGLVGRNLAGTYYQRLRAFYRNANNLLGIARCAFDKLRSGYHPQNSERLEHNGPGLPRPAERACGKAARHP